MNLTLSFDKYVKLEKDDAYNLFCDEKNLKNFKIFLWGLSVAFFIIALVGFFNGGLISYIFIFNFLVFDLFFILLVFFKKIFSVINIRKYLIYLFIFGFIIYTANGVLNTIIFENKHPVTSTKTEELRKKDLSENEIEAKVSVDNGEKPDLLSYSFYFGIFILLFRFSRNELIQLYSLALGIPLIAYFVFPGGAEQDELIVFPVLTLIMFFISFSAESKRKSRFYRNYEQYVKVNYDTIRMKKELDYARQIQLAMLPEPNVKIGKFEISALSIPAMEVGGDYFDYFKLSESELGVFICDVSGHGVASALMLSGLRSSMHLLLEETNNPGLIFERLNRMIRKTQSRKMFVTAIFAVLNTENNNCSLFNAGHLPPYKIDGKTGELFKIKRHGITLGALDEIAPDTTESEVNINFSKGDKLIFYTDGLNEATDSIRNEYGFQRIETILSLNTEKKPSELMTEVIKDVNLFTKNFEQNDDLTLLIVHYS